MHAPSFHDVFSHHGAYPRPGRSFLNLAEQALQFGNFVWRLFKVFYGLIGIAVAATAMLLFVTSEGDSRATTAAKAKAPVEQTSLLPLPSSQVVYVVQSQQQADNLMAYGAGLATADPANLLPNARVSVLVADLPTQSVWARVTMQRVMEAYAGNHGAPAIQVIDLR